MMKAVFLDRDGTINVDKGYVHKISDFEFIPGAIDALRNMYSAGFELFVVTNQSGIALGYYSENDVWKVHEHMFNELFSKGVCLSGMMYCPHHPSIKPCRCRKPEPGMLESLIKGFNVNVVRSYMVGDKVTDVEAGKRAGVKSIRIGSDSVADFCCGSLLEASKFIIGGGA